MTVAHNYGTEYSSQNFGVHIFKVKNDQKYPNKMIVCSGGQFYNFIQGLKVASFIW